MTHYTYKIKNLKKGAFNLLRVIIMREKYNTCISKIISVFVTCEIQSLINLYGRISHMVVRKVIT